MGYKTYSTDRNQQDIIDRLRDIPWVSVKNTARLGEGFVDIVVGYKGINYLFEIKDEEQPPSKRRLNKREQKFHDGWNGQIAKVESLQDCLEIMGITQGA